MPLAPRRYPFRPLADTDKVAGSAIGRASREVLIAGAGPVGLATALGLARRGVAVTVCEDDDSVCEGSRAICLSRHSLEVLDRLGVGETVARQSLPWTTGRSYHRDTEVLTFEMPHGDRDPHPPMVNISQSALEQILVDALDDVPGAEIGWRHHVSFAADDGDHATLEVSTPAGRREVTAGWLVACDGARSITRQCLGLALHGTSYAGHYVIADIHWPSSLPAGRRLWFDPPVSPGRTVILHRQPGDIWRFDCQLPPDADLTAELAPGRIEQRVAAHLDWLGSTEPWTLEWSSVYSARALSLDSYAHGRVLFAGDAAHQVPIFGVRGLNSGLEDAETLAWTLAAVIRDGADPGLLDAYSAERRDAWRQNIARADLSTRFMAPETDGYRGARDAVLALAPSRPELRELIDPRQTTATHARTSPLTIPLAPTREPGIGRDAEARGADGRAAAHAPPRLLPGDPVPDVPLPALSGPPDSPGPPARPGPPSRPVSLHARRGTGFALLAFSERDGERLKAAAGALDGRLPSAGARVLVAPEAAPALGARPGEVFVIRPDGLLLGRFPGADSLGDLAGHVLAGGAADAVRASVPVPRAAPGTEAQPGAGTQRGAGAQRGAEARREELSEAERIWRSLGEGLDAVPAAEREAFLTRLVMLLALKQQGAPVLPDLISEAREGRARA